MTQEYNEKDRFFEDMDHVQKKNIKKKRKIAIIVLVVVIIAALCVEIISNRNKEQVSFTIEVRCDAVVANPESMINQDNLANIPADGTCIAQMKCSGNGGTTALEAVEVACRIKGIALDASSGFVSSLGYLANGDCGDWSGWMFSVNDEFLPVGADEYKVQDGDHITWAYSVDGGSDIGAEW